MERRAIGSSATERTGTFGQPLTRHSALPRLKRLYWPFADDGGPVEVGDTELSLGCATAGPAQPILKWAGGKRALAGELLRLAPARFGTYYEPFLGGGAVFFALGSAPAVIGDANADLIDAYRVVRDDPAGVMAGLDALQPDVLDADFFYTVRSWQPANLPPAQRAARFIFLNKTCYNGLYRVNRRGEFNVPFGRYRQPPQLYQRENLLRAAGLLRRADLRTGDFAGLVAEAGASDFVYLDPPYVPLTPTANFTRYTPGQFRPADQDRLAAVVRDLDARGVFVLLSNSDTPAVRDLYRGFRVTTVYAPRNINSKAGGRQPIAELAIANY